nr:hypothetical protein [Tanacetum cinerariifolium]
EKKLAQGFAIVTLPCASLKVEKSSGLDLSGRILIKTHTFSRESHEHSIIFPDNENISSDGSLRVPSINFLPHTHSNKAKGDYCFPPPGENQQSSFLDTSTSKDVHL